MLPPGRTPHPQNSLPRGTGRGLDRAGKSAGRLAAPGRDERPAHPDATCGTGFRGMAVAVGSGGGQLHHPEAPASIARLLDPYGGGYRHRRSFNVGYTFENVHSATTNCQAGWYPLLGGSATPFRIVSQGFCDLGFEGGGMIAPLRRQDSNPAPVIPGLLLRPEIKEKRAR